VVEPQRHVVGPVAQEREPLGVAHDAVELIAMQDQIALAVGALVDRLAHHLHAAEIQSAIIARSLVVIARHVDDLGAFARLAQDLLDDIVMRLRPEPGAFEPPAIDDVADQIEIIALVMLEEIEQQLGLAAARAQMHVRDEDGVAAARFG
jgi:hypothetical protein